MTHSDQEFLSRDIPLTNRDEWCNAIRCFHHSFYCTWDYNNIIQKSYKENIILTIIESIDKRPICLFIWLPRSFDADYQYKDVFSPYGFGGIAINSELDQITLQMIQKCCYKKNIVSAYLQIHPSVKIKPNTIVSNRRTGLVVDLTAPIEVVNSNISKNMKRDIKSLNNRWNKFICYDKVLIANHASSVYRQSMAIKSADSIYYSFVDLLPEFALLDQCIPVGIIENNQLKSFLIIGICNNFAEYLFSASVPGFESLSKLLLWKSIYSIKSLGCNKFYLGGGITEGDSLQHFKERFGSVKVTLDSAKLITHPQEYHRRCKSLTKLRSNYFPPYF